jgi:hypothetical protein
METREDDLDELAINLSTAIPKARQLKLSASPYILSMAFGPDETNFDRP